MAKQVNLSRHQSVKKGGGGVSQQKIADWISHIVLIYGRSVGYPVYTLNKFLVIKIFTKKL
jgi:hypothetical protein